MTKPLTAKQIEHLPVDALKRRSYPVGNPPGLYCVVRPNGSRSWCYIYRSPRGKNAMMTIGRYPEVGLAAARAEATAARELLRSRIDPITDKKEKENATKSAVLNSVANVCAEWIQRKVVATKSHRETERLINKEIVGVLGDKLIGDIGKPEIFRLLDRIEDRPAPRMRNVVRGLLVRFFGFAIERGYVQISPLTGIKPLPEQNRDRVLSETELSVVWNTAQEIPYPFGPFLRMLILTAQRRGEVAGMSWDELDLGDNAVWTLPRERTKANRQHLVPLSNIALEILKNSPRFVGPHVFSSTGGRRPINGFSKAKRQLDAIIKKNGYEMVPWTVHDLRRSAATWCERNGVQERVIEKILNHSPRGVTKRVYALYDYLTERREALQQWATYLASLEHRDLKLDLTA